MATSTMNTSPEVKNMEALTPREIQVLKLIGEGHSTKVIADMLGISFKTAACHRSKLMAKVGVHETVSLLRWSIRRGIVNP